jgi:hypothetical protein
MLVIQRKIWLKENDNDLVGLPKKEVDSPGAVFDYLIGDYFLKSADDGGRMDKR